MWYYSVWKVKNLEKPLMGFQPELKLCSTSSLGGTIKASSVCTSSTIYYNYAADMNYVLWATLVIPRSYHHATSELGRSKTLLVLVSV